MTPVRPRLSAEQIAFDECVSGWQAVVARLRRKSAAEWSLRDLNQIRRFADDAAQRYDAIGFKDKDRLATTEALHRVSKWARRIKWFDCQGDTKMLDDLCQVVDASLEEDNLYMPSELAHLLTFTGDPDVVMNPSRREPWTRRHLTQAIEDAEERSDFRAIVRWRLEKIPGIGAAAAEAARRGDLGLLRLLAAADWDPMLTLLAQRGEEISGLLDFAANFGAARTNAPAPNADLELKIEMLVAERLLRTTHRIGKRGPKKRLDNDRRSVRVRARNAAARVDAIKEILREHYPTKREREINRMARAVAARQAGVTFETLDDYMTHPAKQRQ